MTREFAYRHPTPAEVQDAILTLIIAEMQAEPEGHRAIPYRVIDLVRRGVALALEQHKAGEAA